MRPSLERALLRALRLQRWTAHLMERLVPFCGCSSELVLPRKSTFKTFNLSSFTLFRPRRTFSVVWSMSLRAVATTGTFDVCSILRASSRPMPSRGLRHWKLFTDQYDTYHATPAKPAPRAALRMLRTLEVIGRRNILYVTRAVGALLMCRLQTQIGEIDFSRSRHGSPFHPSHQTHLTS
jgi:hypothetical protein